MTRVYVVAEGQTEEKFVNDVLYPHLQPLGVYLWPIPLAGIKAYGAVRKVICNLLNQHSPSGGRVTTMMDLYGLPKGPGLEGFPGFTTAAETPDPYDRVAKIEKGLADDVCHHHFIPHMQLHEFESLLFSAPEMFSKWYPNRRAEAKELADGIALCGGPEWVNDGATTAPSKRVKACIPEYDKALMGTLMAIDIGLATMREKCPHFAAWLAELEALA